MVVESGGEAPADSVGAVTAQLTARLGSIGESAGRGVRIGVEGVVGGAHSAVDSVERADVDGAAVLADAATAAADRGAGRPDAGAGAVADSALGAGGPGHRDAPLLGGTAGAGSGGATERPGSPPEAVPASPGPAAGVEPIPGADGRAGIADPATPDVRNVTPTTEATGTGNGRAAESGEPYPGPGEMVVDQGESALAEPAVRSELAAGSVAGEGKWDSGGPESLRGAAVPADAGVGGAGRTPWSSELPGDSAWGSSGPQPASAGTTPWNQGTGSGMPYMPGLPGGLGALSGGERRPWRAGHPWSRERQDRTETVFPRRRDGDGEPGVYR